MDYWMNVAKEIESMGADSICIKDMAGLLLPYEAEKLVKALKSATSLPIDLHTHYTSGVASMTYMKAAEAGVDIIDCAISPFALGTSQPATEVMVEAFKGQPFDTGLDQKLLAKIADHFRPYSRPVRPSLRCIRANEAIVACPHSSTSAIGVK